MPKPSTYCTSEIEKIWKRFLIPKDRILAFFLYLRDSTSKCFKLASNVNRPVSWAVHRSLQHLVKRSDSLCKPVWSTEMWNVANLKTVPDLISWWSQDSEFFFRSSKFHFQVLKTGIQKESTFFHLIIHRSSQSPAGRSQFTLQYMLVRRLKMNYYKS